MVAADGAGGCPVCRGCDVAVACACVSLATSGGAVKNATFQHFSHQAIQVLCNKVPLDDLESLNSGNFLKIH